MSSTAERDVSKTRFIVSVLIVAVIVFAAPAMNALLHVTGVEKTGSTGVDGLDAGVLMKGGSPEAVLDYLEHVANSVESTQAVPVWFQDEIGFLPGARDVRISGEGSVIGYVVDANSEEVLDDLKAALREKGWTCVSLGNVDGATFMKEGGACTWFLATCTQVGSSTTVVARCNA